jgi:hypothetical protein
MTELPLPWMAVRRGQGSERSTVGCTSWRSSYAHIRRHALQAEALVPLWRATHRWPAALLVAVISHSGPARRSPGSEALPATRLRQPGHESKPLPANRTEPDSNYAVAFERGRLPGPTPAWASRSSSATEAERSSPHNRRHGVRLRNRRARESRELLAFPIPDPMPGKWTLEVQETCTLPSKPPGHQARVVSVGTGTRPPARQLCMVSTKATALLGRHTRGSDARGANDCALTKALS